MVDKVRGMMKKILTGSIIFVIILDLLLILFEYPTIQFGAFWLGLNTSRIVYDRPLK